MKKLLYLFGMLLLITCDEYQDEDYKLSEVDMRICENISVHDSNAVNIEAYAFSHIAGLSTGLPTSTWIMVSDSGEIIDVAAKTFRIKSNKWYGIPSTSYYELIAAESNILLGDSVYLYADTSSILNPDGNLVYVADSNWVILPDQGWTLVHNDGITEDFGSSVIGALRENYITSTAAMIIDSLYADTIKIVVDTLIVDSVHVVIDSLSIDTTYAVYTAHKDTLLKINSDENYGFIIVSVRDVTQLVLAYDKFLSLSAKPISYGILGDEIITEDDMSIELVSFCQKYDSFKNTLKPYVKMRLVYDFVPGDYLLFYSLMDVGDQTSSTNKSYHLVITDNS